jgi:hypothetical protein
VVAVAARSVVAEKAAVVAEALDPGIEQRHVDVVKVPPPLLYLLFVTVFRFVFLVNCF